MLDVLVYCDVLDIWHLEFEDLGVPKFVYESPERAEPWRLWQIEWTTRRGPRRDESQFNSCQLGCSWWLDGEIYEASLVLEGMQAWRVDLDAFVGL
jgi:hypothetical protein